MVVTAERPQAAPGLPADAQRFLSFLSQVLAVPGVRNIGWEESGAFPLTLWTTLEHLDPDAQERVHTLEYDYRHGPGAWLIDVRVVPLDIVDEGALPKRDVIFPPPR